MPCCAPGLPVCVPAPGSPVPLARLSPCGELLVKGSSQVAGLSFGAVSVCGFPTFLVSSSHFSSIFRVFTLGTPTSELLHNL